MSGQVTTLTNPTNLGTGYWEVNINPSSFEYTGEYTVNVTTLADVSLYQTTMVINTTLQVTKYEINNTRDNVIYK